MSRFTPLSSVQNIVSRGTFRSLTSIVPLVVVALMGLTPIPIQALSRASAGIASRDVMVAPTISLFRTIFLPLFRVSDPPVRKAEDSIRG